jgi:hypothetical protein
MSWREVHPAAKRGAPVVCYPGATLISRSASIRAVEAEFEDSRLHAQKAILERLLLPR